MPRIDSEHLGIVAASFAERAGLTPAERTELLRIAQGYACKDSAAAANVSPETIRARRKRIYRKLEIGGAGELIASMLAVSLRLLAERSRREEAPPPAAEHPDASAGPTIH